MRRPSGENVGDKLSAKRPTVKRCAQQLSADVRDENVRAALVRVRVRERAAVGRERRRDVERGARARRRLASRRSRASAARRPRDPPEPGVREALRRPATTPATAPSAPAGVSGVSSRRRCRSGRPGPRTRAGAGWRRCRACRPPSGRSRRTAGAPPSGSRRRWAAVSVRPARCRTWAAFTSCSRAGHRRRALAPAPPRTPPPEPCRCRS